MATNKFFNKYTSQNQQLLLDSLVVENFKIYGEDMYYVPRQINNYDSIYGQDNNSSYVNAYPIEIYIKSRNGFGNGAGGEFLSHFGVEIHDQIILSVARTTFENLVIRYTQQLRPNEGDLIYFPLNGKVFQIKYVNNFENFYQLGKLYTWELTCENFAYSGEVFNTGIPVIDAIAKTLDMNMLDYFLLAENGNSLITENNSNIMTENYNIQSMIPADDTAQIEKESDQIINFNQNDPFSEGTL